MIEISVKTTNLTKKFGNFTAVESASIEVLKGEIFGFLGANGAGKTTMIRMLCGLLKPTSGSGSVAGFNLKKENEKIKLNIGYMSQKFSLYDDLKVMENINFFGGVYGLTNSQIKKRSAVLLKEVGLLGLENNLTASVPLGFKQRLALICAILHDPPIIFLDEPTSGVDPRARRDFWDIIYRFADKGKTIFVTTHFMDEAEYCHRVSIMRDGKIIAMDKPAELRKQYGETMQKVFLALVS